MHVNTGAPNAEDLKDDDLLFIAVQGQWYTAKVVIGVFITFKVVNGYMGNYPIKLIDKWAHCEGPVESASVDDESQPKKGIDVIEEPAEFFKETGVYENCIFCENPTDTWHEDSNNPVCRKCAKIKTVEDLKAS